VDISPESTLSDKLNLELPLNRLNSSDKLHSVRDIELSLKLEKTISKKKKLVETVKKYESERLVFQQQISALEKEKESRTREEKKITDKVTENGRGERNYEPTEINTG